MKRSTDPEARRRTDHIVGMALMAHHTTDDRMIELLDMFHDGRITQEQLDIAIWKNVEELAHGRS